MQNTDYSQLCKIDEISLGGKALRIKGYKCSENGGPYLEKSGGKKIQLSICPTSFCAANCPFCLAHNTPDKKYLDVTKLRTTLEKLKEADVVRGVSVTGGEPFTDVGLLNEVLNMVFSILGDGIETSLNTNGMYIDRIKDIEACDKLESIHISRHHYDDTINNELFGKVKMPGRDELRDVICSFSNDHLFVLNCMMAKGYIDSADEICRYLDFTAETGAYKASFITATIVNDYTREKRIDYKDVIKGDDARFLLTRRFEDFDWCRCQDGIYISGTGIPVEFYGRSSCPSGCEYVRGLVYGTDNKLRTGFGGEIIW